MLLLTTLLIVLPWDLEIFTKSNNVFDLTLHAAHYQYKIPKVVKFG